MVSSKSLRRSIGFSLTTTLGSSAMGCITDRSTWSGSRPLSAVLSRVSDASGLGVGAARTNAAARMEV